MQFKADQNIDKKDYVYYNGRIKENKVQYEYLLRAHVGSTIYPGRLQYWTLSHERNLSVGPTTEKILSA